MYTELTTILIFTLRTFCDAVAKDALVLAVAAEKSTLAWNVKGDQDQRQTLEILGLSYLDLDAGILLFLQSFLTLVKISI